MLIEILINVEEDEYRAALAKGYVQHYCEEPEDDLELDDVDDFVRAVPHLLLGSDNTTITI